MANLIEYLKKFNRKERYWLLHNALEHDSDTLRRKQNVEVCGPKFVNKNNGPFILSANFRKKLECKLEPKVPIPPNAFVAMDYHFDWITMALFSASNPGRIPEDSIDIEGSGVFKEELKKVNNSQQDIDLLIAFENGGKNHLILIEAKADTSWNNEQLEGKAKRLKIFDEKEIRTNCEPHFILMSLTEPKRLDVKWPEWMKDGKMKTDKKPHWLQLDLDERYQVERQPKGEGRNYTHIQVKRIPKNQSRQG